MTQIRPQSTPFDLDITSGNMYLSLWCYWFYPHKTWWKIFISAAEAVFFEKDIDGRPNYCNSRFSEAGPTGNTKQMVSQGGGFRLTKSS